MRKYSVVLYLNLLLFGVLSLSFLLLLSLMWIYFGESREQLVQSLTLSVLVFSLIQGGGWLIFARLAKKFTLYQKSLEEAVERREYALNTTGLTNFDLIGAEINKTLDLFFRNQKRIVSIEETTSALIGELRHKNELLEGVMDAHPQGVVVFNDGVVEYANKGALKRFGVEQVRDLHRENRRIQDFFDIKEGGVAEGYQDDSWCYSLLKHNEPVLVSIKGEPLLLQAFCPSSEDQLIAVSFTPQLPQERP